MLDIAACPKPQNNVFKVRNIGAPPDKLYPMVFFDGATADFIGGAGVCIWINEQHYITLKLGYGRCTNTRAELLAL